MNLKQPKNGGGQQKVGGLAVRNVEFERRIRELCEQIVTCHDDSQLIALTQDLRSAVHDRVEAIRPGLGISSSND